MSQPLSAPDMLRSPQQRRRVILVGSPNVGKSLLFTLLTGRYVTVSNYPGTTIELTRAAGTFGGEVFEVVDTPGTNSLIPHSEDERVTRDLILSSDAPIILQVADIRNLRRALFLSLQIADHALPFTLCLNMSDEADEEGLSIDLDQLSFRLGVDVVATSAIHRSNLDSLRDVVATSRLGRTEVRHAPQIERGIDSISDLLPDLPVAPRALAIAILASDATIASWLRGLVSTEVLSALEDVRRRTTDALSEPVSSIIDRDRMRVAGEIARQVMRSTGRKGSHALREWIGRATMHPLWGVPFLAFVLFVAWWFVGRLGAGTAVDFVEETIFNRFINPWVIRLFDLITPFPHVHAAHEGVIGPGYEITAAPARFSLVARFFHDLFVGEFGVFTMALTYAVAIVLPVVTTFFIFFGFMEDSGYLPRLAVMLNRFFKAMGLNGKAVLPMVLGLGCDTMATLTTRILETKKEAIIVTLLLALGVPCSAQLGVIMAMLAPLGSGGVAIWLGVIVMSLFLVGWLASKLVRGSPGDFILEVPPIRRPRLSNILIKVLARTEWYLKEAVPLFVAGTLLLYLLDVTRMLPLAQRAISPLIVGLLSLPAEASNAFLIGFLRRDYGAAGLFMMQRAGELDAVQTLVSLTVVTLFIPCIANLLIIVKERGAGIAAAMTAFIVVYAFGIGWMLERLLRVFEFGA